MAKMCEVNKLKAPRIKQEFELELRKIFNSCLDEDNEQEHVSEIQHVKLTRRK